MNTIFHILIGKNMKDQEDDIVNTAITAKV
jgi:hypothetical protein